MTRDLGAAANRGYRAVRGALGRVGVARIPGARRLDAAVRRAVGTRAEVLGHTMVLDRGDTLFLARHGVYEPTFTALVEGAVRAGDVVVDVGANIGYHTLLFARAAGPTGRVIAFEPAPDTFRLLEENVRANGYENVELVQAAASDASGRVTLQLSDENPGDHRIVGPGGREGIEVACVTLDERLAEGPLPDVVKLDVQGAEPRVLRGMSSVLGRAPVRLLLTEFWPRGLVEAGEDPPAFLAAITGAGYELRLVDEDAGRVRAASPEELLELHPPSTDRWANLACVR